jgi:hypothetical protein
MARCSLETGSRIMMQSIVIGIAAVVAAAALYIGVHHWAGYGDVAIRHDALALAGIIAVALVGSVVREHRRNQR